MSYGLYDYSRRARRRFWTRLLKLLAVLLAFAVAAGFSYQIGVEQLKRREVSLTQEIATLTEARLVAEQRAAQFQQRAQAAEVKVGELEVRYQRDVPSGDLGRLKDMLARKLTEGVDPGRLAFVIDQTGTPRSCGASETKRFVLTTPLYKGANTTVTFGDGAVVIGGEGPSFRNATGSPEAWFDVSKPIVIRFTLADGSTSQTTGVLPIDHSIAVQDKEYRFRISAGARSFVEVAGSTCPFP